MKLKDLIPSFEVCKKIPKGEFTDSVFVWTIDYSIKEPYVVLREYVEDSRKVPISPYPLYPAPTYAELYNRFIPCDYKMNYYGLDLMLERYLKI